MITSSPAAGTHYSQDEGSHKAHIQKELTLIYSGKKCDCVGFNRGERHSGGVPDGGSELEQKVIHRQSLRSLFLDKTSSSFIPR